MASLKFDVTVDIAIALDWLRSDDSGDDPFKFTGDISSNTEIAWDSVIWQDPRPKPTWAEVVACMPDALTYYYYIYYHENFVNDVGESIYEVYRRLSTRIADIDPDEPAERASSVVNTFTAGETISALQAVYADGETIFKGNSDNLVESNVIGISLTAGNPGDSIDVLQYGVLEDPSFSFSPADLLFLTFNGSLSSVSPTEGYLTRLGRAITPSSVLVLIDSPKTL